MRRLSLKSGFLSFVALGLLLTAAPVRADDKEKKQVEAVGADLCRAVRSMKGDPILDSYSVNGNKLTMKVCWFGLVSGFKYTSDITITFEPDGTISEGGIRYSDNGPKYSSERPTNHDPAYVEKWRRDWNKNK